MSSAIVVMSESFNSIVFICGNAGVVAVDCKWVGGASARPPFTSSSAEEWITGLRGAGGKAHRHTDTQAKLIRSFGTWGQVRQIGNFTVSGKAVVVPKSLFASDTDEGHSVNLNDADLV